MKQSKDKKNLSLMKLFNRKYNGDICKYPVELVIEGQRAAGIFSIMIFIRRQNI